MSLKIARGCRACGLALVLLAGCENAPAQRAGGSQNPSAVASPAPVVSTGNVQGPIASTLSGPAQPRIGDALWLTLRIDRHLLSDSAEVSVQVTLPDEVTLQQGELQTRVLPDVEPVAELRYALQTSVVPAENAVFTVTVSGEGFGYQASLPYRFGRESELPVAPERTEQVVRVAERNFGAAVPISPLP